MEPKATRYYLDVNGFVEGPMAGRELVWKAGMANSDDVLRFRSEGSEQWQPLTGTQDNLRQFTEAEAAIPASLASPPKLKLKKRAESPPPLPPEMTAFIPTQETPPPLPGSTDSTSVPPDSEFSDDSPPPPPGAPEPPDFNLSNGTSTATPPTLSQGTAPSSVLPSPPSLPPPKMAPLLLASLLISTLIAGYVYFLMKQPVNGSAMASLGTGSAREAKDVSYAVLTRQAGLNWKTASLDKLVTLGNKAKDETAASSGRADTLLASTSEVTAKYGAECRALFMVGTNAKYLSINFDPQSKADIKTLRELESAADLAEAYLSPATRSDLTGRRYQSVALATKMEGFPGLTAAFEKEIRLPEAQLTEEYERLRPVVEDATNFMGAMMYVVPEEIPAEARGWTDEFGRFEPKLAPGDYYVVASKDAAPGGSPLGWAIGFQVKALTENTLSLDDHNLGNKAPESLWQRTDTLAAERDISAIRDRARQVRALLDNIRELRTEIGQRQADLNRLL
jgi:hypothetical protein